MKKELDEALCRDFPNLFRDRYGDPRDTALCWGFEVGDGWEPLIREAAAICEAEIVRMLKEHPEQTKEAMENGYLCASQIKEKYGTLRFYLSSGTDAMWKAVNAAEAKSCHTCERCGKPGKNRGERWYYTACDEHTEEGDKDNAELQSKED
jgi:hypothetical protein